MTDAILDAVRQLRSEHNENAEYDRALYELAAMTLGWLADDVREAVDTLERERDEQAGTYSVVRMYRGDHSSETIRTGLTLTEAQAHCRDPETSSSTATSPEATKRTEEHGAWFDGYELEDE